MINNDEYNKVRNEITGRRILGIDFGLKRVGTAVTDEFHVTLTPREVFDFSSPDFYNKIVEFIDKENIGVIVVGIPVSKSISNKKIIEEISKFSEKIHELTGKNVFSIDESYSSREAVRTMVEVGKKKKKRSKKGETDKIAAAIILRDFLSMYDNFPMG